MTEDTLLSAMENAGAKEIPEEAEHTGIGTPATRAAILEKLVAEGFLTRKKARKVTSLVPTELGKALVAILPEQLQSPQLTADWEHQLLEIERRQKEPTEFLDGITAFLRDLFHSYEPVSEANALFPSQRKIIGKCPRCGSNVAEAEKGFFCENRECRFVLWKQNRFFEAKKVPFTAAMAAELLENGKLRLKGCVSERTGKTYDADVILKDDGEKTSFEMEFPRRGRK